MTSSLWAFLSTVVNYPTKHNHTDLVYYSLITHYYMFRLSRSTINGRCRMYEKNIKKESSRFTLLLIITILLKNGILFVRITPLLFRKIRNNVISTTVTRDFSPFTFCVCILHLPDDGSSGLPKHVVVYSNRLIY